MKQVAIVGTQGVPAKYGGFESLVENIIGDNCPSDTSYTVFCSSKDYNARPDTYKGAKLSYVPFHANGMQSIIYDIISLLKTINKYDVVLILGISGCIFLPVFRLFYHKKLIINIDGLEHRRAKWPKPVQLFLRISEATAIKFADIIIADNKGIQDYVYKVYQKKAELIAYGGDHVLRDVSEKQEISILEHYHLTPKQYSITVCRIEPENNCQMTLDAFSKTNKQFVFIGNWDSSEYGQSLKNKYKRFSNIRLFDPIYDLDTLYILRKNAEYYIHGHSAGGTNPSLVEAMFLDIPVLAFDVVYNRESTNNKAHYFHTNKELQSLATCLTEEERIANKAAMKEIAEGKYTWAKIANLYNMLY